MLLILIFQTNLASSQEHDHDHEQEQDGSPRRTYGMLDAKIFAARFTLLP